MSPTFLPSQFDSSGKLAHFWKQPVASSPIGNGLLDDVDDDSGGSTDHPALVDESTDGGVPTPSRWPAQGGPARVSDHPTGLNTKQRRRLKRQGLQPSADGSALFPLFNGIREAAARETIEKFNLAAGPLRRAGEDGVQERVPDSKPLDIFSSYVGAKLNKHFADEVMPPKKDLPPPAAPLDPNMEKFDPKFKTAMTWALNMAGIPTDAQVRAAPASCPVTGLVSSTTLASTSSPPTLPAHPIEAGDNFEYPERLKKLAASSHFMRPGRFDARGNPRSPSAKAFTNCRKSGRTEFA